MQFTGVSEEASREGTDPLECSQEEGTRQIGFLWVMIGPRHLGSVSEVTGIIYKSVPSVFLFRPEGVTPIGVAFFQHVIPDVEPIFVPLETAFRDGFHPYLLGGSISKVSDSLCKWITWVLNWSAIGIPDPTQTAPANFDTLENCCVVLNDYLINKEALYLRAHITQLR